MKLPKKGREYYAVKIETEPEVDAWEASFDDGDSYTAADDVDDGYTRWLVNGAGFVPEDAIESIPLPDVSRVLPRVRAIDNPEVVIRRAPPIDLW